MAGHAEMRHDVRVPPGLAFRVLGVRGLARALDWRWASRWHPVVATWRQVVMMIAG